MNASTNSPSAPTTNTTHNTKGAVNIETVASTRKKGERVEISITSKEMHGAELLKFRSETFGESVIIHRRDIHRLYGEKVFLAVASILGYVFGYSCRTGRVEGGTKGG